MKLNGVPPTVVVGVLLLAQLLTYHRMRHLVQKSAFFLFFINAVLCIIAGYRLVRLVHAVCRGREHQLTICPLLATPGHCIRL
jgi:uncharacterized membrane protein YfcA